MPSSTEEAKALLSTLWQGNGYGELRVLNENGALKPFWLNIPLNPTHLNPALDWAFKRNAEGYNVYFGVHPRKTWRGRNEDVDAYRSLVVDFDKPDLSWPLYNQLAAAGCPASICVRTPRGMHLYWLLSEPEPTTGPAREHMQLLQKALCSDSVHDPARILRLPGAVCHKTDQGVPVYLSWIDHSLVYKSEVIANAVHSLWPDVKVEAVKNQNWGDIGALHIDPTGQEIDLMSKFNYPCEKGTRSEACAAFIYAALLQGWDQEKIKTTLLTLPIGGHYIDRGRGADSSFEYDYNKSRRNIYVNLEQSFRVIIDSASILVDIDLSRKLRLKIKPWEQRFQQNAGFYVWINIIDDDNDPKAKRWKAFLSAVGGLTFTEEQLLSKLPGKKIRVVLHDDTQTVAKFLPDFVRQ